MFCETAVVRMHQVQRAVPQHFCLVIPQQTDHGGIDEYEPAAAVNDVLCVIHDEAIVFGVDVQQQRGLFPFLQLRSELIHELCVVIFQPERFEDGVRGSGGGVDHERGKQQVQTATGRACS